jgi:hypothetical protein
MPLAYTPLSAGGDDESDSGASATGSRWSRSASGLALVAIVCMLALLARGQFGGKTPPPHHHPKRKMHARAAHHSAKHDANIFVSDASNEMHVSLKAQPETKARKVFDESKSATISEAAQDPTSMFDMGTP